MAKKLHTQLPGPKRTPPKKVHPNKPMVTDHALVRYMERVLGVDVETIRGSILDDTQVNKIKALRDVKLPLGPGVTAVVIGGYVVTIQ